MLAETVKQEAVPVKRKPLWQRRVASVGRWLHIYLSMVSFGVVLFFSVTGLTLNHTEWFAGQQRVLVTKGALPKEWTGRSVAKLEIVEHLRSANQVRGALSDFRIDDAQLAVSFKGPGYTADTFIDRSTGGYELTETRMGLFAVMNDLHKGRDSGRVWGWVIDLSAILLVLVSFSGLVLVFFLQKRLVSGMWTLAAGAALCYAAYLLWVP